MNVRKRRFTILAAILVALNLGLWLAPQGLALRQAFINQLFGPRLIRAEVVLQGGANGGTQDVLIDRGTVLSVAAAAVTIREADGMTYTIPADATTQIVGGGRRFGDYTQLRRGFRVLITREANSPATSIQIEGRGAALP
jgi:hypothetical protein